MENNSRFSHTIRPANWAVPSVPYRSCQSVSVPGIPANLEALERGILVGCNPNPPPPKPTGSKNRLPNG